MPVAVVGYLALRLIPGTASLALAQVVFLLVIAAAAVAAEFAFTAAPAGLERRAWSVAPAALSVIFIAQAYRAWFQIAVSPVGPPSPSTFDSLNLVAALLFLYGMSGLMEVGRLQLAERVRLGFDTVAFLAVAFIGVYQLAVRPVTGDVAWHEPLQWTAYSLAGAVVLFCAAWMLLRLRKGVERAVGLPAAVALGIFGTGMLLWPLWRGYLAADVPRWGDALVGTVYVVAAYLFMLAALTRARRAAEPWRISNPRKAISRGTLMSTWLSLCVLAGVGVTGWLVYTRGESGDAQILVACGVIATLALVARTAASAVETVLARSAAGIDPVTGVRGVQSFLQTCNDVLTLAERSGRPFSIILFDIDAFSRVNAALGHAGGDRVLARVAEAVTDFIAGRGELFRLNADEFAVTCSGTESEAAVMAAEILAVIRGLSPEKERSLSASFGVAGVPEGGCDTEKLVERARAAESWAKYHGKGRVVRFDERIVRALGVEGRLRAGEDNAGLNMVRAIASATDARDPRNYYHSRNVAALSTMFSEALRLEPERVRRIEIAALLHDCGRLGLPESLIADVLRTSRQQLAAREHSLIGEQVTLSLGMKDVPAWVRHHHERWDGAGYPDGLEGEAVPLESRIIALADAYDAMTSGTRNRPPVSRAAALQEIDLGMGSRFDPMLAERFIEVVGETASLGWSDEWEIR